MQRFDEKIKEKIVMPKMPCDFDERVDRTLAALPPKKQNEMLKEEYSTEKKKSACYRFYRSRFSMAMIAIFVLCGIVVFATKSEANVITDFVYSLFDLMHINHETAQEAGVTSKKTDVEQKPELFLEMKEVVVDSHNMYLRIQITAPGDISFGDEISFDYFAFTKGENYNASALIGGVTDCVYQESKPGKDNIASYLMHLSTTDVIEDGEMVTACFKDLVVHPNSDNPEMLVEGMWSLTFPADYTVTESIKNEYPLGRYPFSFMGTTADLISVDMTPLACSIVMDVSTVDYEQMNISDTSVVLRLHMIDGTSYLLQSHDFDEETYISSGSEEVNTLDDNRVTLTKVFEFEDVIDLSKVVAIEVEDSMIWFSEVE